MADDTPDTPEASPPAPRRRAAPRKTTAKPAARKPKAATESASRTTTDTASDAGERTARAVKPRSTKRATPARTTPTAADTVRKPATKRTSTKTATTKAAPAKRTAKAKSTLDRATDRVGGRWAAAALAGVAAAGATAAAMLTLRGSSARNLGTEKKPIDITGSGDKGPAHPVDVHGTAHQPDGTDSSASFQAGIADENTVPDKG